MLNRVEAAEWRGSFYFGGVKEDSHLNWDQAGNPEAHHRSRRITDHSTLADTCMLFSCMFKMASEILMSMGSSTILMLKGPLSLPATSNMASAKRDSQTAKKVMALTSGLLRWAVLGYKRWAVSRSGTCQRTK